MQLCLCLQDPVINDIFPTFGPKSGNTMLTIRGAFLDTGNQQSVTIGEKICKIQRLVYLFFGSSRCFALLFSQGKRAVCILSIPECVFFFAFSIILSNRSCFYCAKNSIYFVFPHTFFFCFSLTSTMITCKTPSHAFTSKEWVKLTIDSVKRQAATQFTYNEDPIIINIQPSHSFMR